MGTYCKGRLSLFLIIGIVLMCRATVACAAVPDELEGLAGRVLMASSEVQANDPKEKPKGTDSVSFVQPVEEEVVRKYFKCERKWLFAEENDLLAILETLVMRVDIVSTVRLI